MELKWVEDPTRRGWCWDLRADGIAVGWVMREPLGRWKTYIYSLPETYEEVFDTKEEAMTMVVALVRMGG